MAAVVAIVVLARAMSRHKAHLFDVIGVVYFVGLLVLLAIIHPGDISTWGRYAQAVAHGSLTVIVFGSVLVATPSPRATPGSRLPRRCGTARTFMLSIERSRFWGLAFLVGTISMALAGATDSRQILLRVIVPFGALAYAFTYTQRQANFVRHQRLAPRPGFQHIARPCRPLNVTDRLVDGRTP